MARSMGKPTAIFGGPGRVLSNAMIEEDFSAGLFREVHSRRLRSGPFLPARAPPWIQLKSCFSALAVPCVADVPPVALGRRLR